jgi:sugar phosphate permease
MTIIDDKIGLKLISLISTILVILTNFLLYHSSNIYYVYGCMVLFGIINAMNYMPLIKNCLLYFPNKKGLINGFVLFGYGTSSLIYNSFADYLINPEYKKINPSTGFFDINIALNVKKYLLFFNIFNGVFAVVSFLMQFEYKKDKEECKDKEKELINKNKSSEEDLPISLKEAFIQATKGKQLYQLWLMSTILQVVSFTISNTYRSFAQQCFMDEYLLSILTKTNSILSGLSRLIWGALFDKFTFKCLYSICIITQIFVDLILVYSINYPFLFFFLLCF